MELYQLSKYENIADRLKRLSSPTNFSAAEAKGQGIRQKHRIFEDKRDLTEQSWKSKYTQGTAYSKFSTLEGDKGEEQSSYKQFQNLHSPRQAKPAEKFERTATSKNIETKVQLSRLEDEEVYRNEGQVSNSKKALAKVRSDGNFKIDQILESFNTYKQNKEKFLSTLNKQLPIQTQDTRETATHELLEKNELDSQRYPKEKDRLFLQIDNIWNENRKGEQKNDSIPKFERSFTRTEAVELIADVFSPVTFESTDRPKNFSRSKLILRNIVKQVDTQNSESNALKTLMMSPRGPRVPGKICRNNDKTFTTYSRQGV